MKIIILGGCGAMGSEATRDLARTSDFEEIVIADADLARAEALAAELGGGRVRAIAVDAKDEAALTESLRGFDVLAKFSPGSRRFFWQDGEFIETPAFSGAKQVRFADPVGEIETFFVPHSETHTVHRFIGKGVRRVDVRGTWRPEIMRALRTFADLGLTGAAMVELDGQMIPARQLLRAHILEHAADFCGEGEWAVLRNVAVLGQLNGRAPPV